MTCVWSKTFFLEEYNWQFRVVCVWHWSARYHKKSLRLFGLFVCVHSLFLSLSPLRVYTKETHLLFNLLFLDIGHNQQAWWLSNSQHIEHHLNFFTGRMWVGGNSTIGFDSETTCLLKNYGTSLDSFKRTAGGHGRTAKGGMPLLSTIQWEWSDHWPLTHLTTRVTLFLAQMASRITLNSISLTLTHWLISIMSLNTPTHSYRVFQKSHIHLKQGKTHAYNETSHPIGWKVSFRTQLSFHLLPLASWWWSSPASGQLSAANCLLAHIQLPQAANKWSFSPHMCYFDHFISNCHLNHCLSNPNYLSPLIVHPSLGGQRGGGSHLMVLLVCGWKGQLKIKRIKRWGCWMLIGFDSLFDCLLLSILFSLLSLSSKWCWCWIKKTGGKKTKSSSADAVQLDNCLANSLGMMKLFFRFYSSSQTIWTNTIQCPLWNLCKYLSTTFSYSHLLYFMNHQLNIVFCIMGCFLVNGPFTNNTSRPTNLNIRWFSQRSF